MSDEALHELRSATEAVIEAGWDNAGWQKTNIDPIILLGLVNEAIASRGELTDALASIRAELDAAVAALDTISAPKLAGDIEAGWEIVSLPKLGRSVTWEVDRNEVLPTLATLVEGGAVIWSVTPVAALRRAARAIAGEQKNG